MNLRTLQPSYSLRPIQSLPSLAVALGISEAELVALIRKAPSLYRKGKKPKDDGTFRIYYDALQPLKTIQGRLLRKILDRVTWPPYLFGGVRDLCNPRDYVGNANIHSGAALQFKTDVASFFPSIKVDLVRRIWEGIFRFSRPVSDALTALTTYRGFLPQGTRTAQAIANLAFWDFEPEIIARLAVMGFRYTRLTDDITISTNDPRAIKRLGKAIQLIHGMLRAHGFRRKGKKERISTQRGPMMVNNVLTNRRLSLLGRKRNEIAREVIALTKRIEKASYSLLSNEESELRHVAGRLNTLARFHPKEAQRLGTLLYRVTPPRTAKCTGLGRWATNTADDR